MSDAAAPGPSPEDAETEPTAAAPSAAAAGEVDDVPSGEPDQDLVDEVTASVDDDPATGDPAPTTDPGAEVPTGEPDAVLVAEASGPGADGPPDDASPTPFPEGTAPVDDRTTTDAAAADATPDATAPAAGDAALATLVEEVAGARSDIAGVRAGVDALLPDLAAAAREETVSTGLAGLQRSVEELVRLTRRADEHVAELHGENQRLRAGELASATRPMLRDLVRLSDEVAQLASASHPDARADLELVGSRLLDTLARWGLTPFTPAVGDPLDATRHQGVGRVASADGDPGTIASVRRPGFADDAGRAFRPAEVEVFAAAPPPPDDDTPSEE